mmetsp:Transcript_10781/g.34394  ORF Transcript_10781/g.34394 Transcript_10781/m.34394 type:complete len:201 (+) Transcript_10781:170-772(+)
MGSRGGEADQHLHPLHPQCTGLGSDARRGAPSAGITHVWPPGAASTARRPQPSAHVHSECEQDRGRAGAWGYDPDPRWRPRRGQIRSLNVHPDAEGCVRQRLPRRLRAGPLPPALALSGGRGARARLAATARRGRRGFAGQFANRAHCCAAHQGRTRGHSLRTSQGDRCAAGRHGQGAQRRCGNPWPRGDPWTRDVKACS